MSKIIEKPWGHEEIWAWSDKYVGKLLHINKGHRLSLQYHQKKEETIRVWSGVLTLRHRPPEDPMLGPLPVEELTLNPGDSFHIKPGHLHRFEARDGDVLLIEVSTPEIDDVVRIEDDYNR